MNIFSKYLNKKIQEIWIFPFHFSILTSTLEVRAIFQKQDTWICFWPLEVAHSMGHKNTNGWISRGNCSLTGLMLLLLWLTWIQPCYLPDTVLIALWSIFSSCFFNFIFTDECQKYYVTWSAWHGKINLKYTFYVFKPVIHRLLQEILLSLSHTVIYLITIQWKGHDGAFCKSRSISKTL